MKGDIDSKCFCVHTHSTLFQRVYIQTISMKRNNFQKSTSSTIITPQIHNEDRILHCFVDCKFSFIYYGFQPSLDVYQYKIKQDLLLNLIQKRNTMFILKNKDKLIYSRSWTKGWKLSFIVVFFFSLNQRMRIKHPISQGKFTFTSKKTNKQRNKIVLEKNKEGIIWLYQDCCEVSNQPKANGVDTMKQSQHQGLAFL